MTPTIFLGPPGTGKTTTLINVVQQALERGVPPDRIGYISFTRRAAQEAVDRACARFKQEKKDFPYFSTIHSLCYRQLGVRRGEVLEGAKLQEFAKYAGVRITGRLSDDGTWNGFDLGDRVLFMENLARIRGQTLEQAYQQEHDNLPWREVRRVAMALREFKQAHGLLDFTDLLQEFVRSGVRLNLSMLLVDEAQDLSHLQWQVVQQVAQGCPDVSVAGDDDQAIYRWAGADVDHLIEMQGDARVLGQSYRVPPAVQQLANAIIGRVRHRRPKQWSARTGGQGLVGTAHEFAAADVSTGRTLVLARNAYVLKEQVEPELRRQGIIYEKNGHSSIGAGVLAGITAWERLRRGEQVTAAEARDAYKWARAGRAVKRGHKQLPGFADEDMVSTEVLRQRGGLLLETPWFDSLDMLPKDEIGYLRAARQRGEKLGSKPRVVVSTIHGSKGGEADHVVLLRDMAARTHREMLANPDDERRCWYVAVTRAKERLTVVDAQTNLRCPWV
jgi:DNA helicase-2/ATP-dependent DNA helicase PcrA